MSNVYFISGIDTGVGKSVATGLMARALLRRGRDVITMKMVQTGNVGFSEDLDLHRAFMGKRFPEDDAGLTAPQIFAFPSSPELAARREGKTVDLDAIARAAKALAEKHEIVLVEGAGGLAVPLASATLAIDFAAAQGWPLVLVGCGRLGSINHTLLSFEAALARKMTIAGFVYNWYDGADPEIDADTPAFAEAWLRRRGLVVPTVRIGRVPKDGPWPDLDVSPIFG